MSNHAPADERRDRRDTNALFSANPLKLGLFGPNCDRGCAMTLSDDVPLLTWDYTKKIAQLADEAVITAAAADGLAAVGAHKLKYRLGIVVQAADDAGVDGEGNAGGGQQALQTVKVILTLAAEEIDAAGCAGADALADLTLAV